MRNNTWRRLSLGAVLAGGALLAGPCGITSLQFREFAVSSVIRTVVNTTSAAIEAAILDSATQPGANAP